ncbi:MAG: polyphenol oxidase family protein [Acidimicrobiales bacterium]
MSAPASGLERAGGLPVLRWPAVSAAGVDAVVTTRRGGVSAGPYRSLNLAFHVGDDPAAVAENRRRAAAAVGATPADLVFGAQVHGRNAAVVTAAERGRGSADLADAVPDADALVTTEPGPVLVTLVADCVPLVLVDPAAGVLATVHAGWRGTAAGVARSALDAMGAMGADPARVVAGIGPAVSPDTYRVGDEVADALRDALGGGEGVVRPSGDGGWLADLCEANRRSLVQAGVGPERISVAEVTTGDPGLFFSDRAARPCGRFGLLARLRP